MMRTPLLVAAGALMLVASGCAQPSPPPAAEAKPDTAHTSQNALDWAGVYRGVLPCADCSGIEMVIVLRADGSYAAYSKYLGEGDGAINSRDGRFTWSAAGNSITLSDDTKFLVGEGHLTRLALDGSRITGPLAEHYVLAKVPADSVTDRYWKLVELNGRPVPKLAREPYFILRAAEGRVTGFGGCNNFTGAFKLDAAAARISFSQIASTQMACLSGMEVEQAFHEVLNTADNYSLAGFHLTLNRARMAPLARFEAVYLR